MVITFLPLNRILAQVLVKLIHQRKEKDLELRTKYITKEALEVPTVALSQAGQEIHWLGHNILDNMLQILPRALSTGDARWISELEKAEQRVDWHYAQLHNFLKELFGGNMTRQQIVENHNLQLIAKELESIADCLVTMARLAQKIHIGKIFVARKEWVLLEELYLVVADNYLALLRLFDSKEPAIAIRINEAHSGIIEAYNRLQGDIVCRIQEDDNDKDWKENLSAGQNAIIELGNLFYKIGEHIASIVKVMS